MFHYGTPETANDRANRILNESSPYLREIWAHGYDEVREINCEDVYELICRPLRYMKTITRMEMCDVMATLRIKTIISGVTMRPYAWIAEEDGSAERFRQLIKIETKQQ